MALGKTQREVLRALNEHGYWRDSPHVGWVWDTHSNTHRIIQSLVTKGAAFYDPATSSFYPLWDKQGDPFWCVILVDVNSTVDSKRVNRSWGVVSPTTLPNVVQAIMATHLIVHSLRFFYHDSHAIYAEHRNRKAP